LHLRFFALSADSLAFQAKMGAFDNQVVMITGSAQGIGFGIAQ
jgi:hypothetical protein